MVVIRLYQELPTRWRRMLSLPGVAWAVAPRWLEPCCLSSGDGLEPAG